MSSSNYNSECRFILIKMNPDYAAMKSWIYSNLLFSLLDLIQGNYMKGIMSKRILVLFKLQFRMPCHSHGSESRFRSYEILDPLDFFFSLLDLIQGNYMKGIILSMLSQLVRHADQSSQMNLTDSDRLESALLFIFTILCSVW